MADDTFQGIVSHAIADAVDFVDSTVAKERAEALKYYLGKPFGDEREGRSQVVMTEVRDTIEALLPGLMRIFFSAEHAVEFVPQGEEDVAAAEQATDYVNWIFQRDNPGFQIAMTWLKDGLLSKIGIVKFYWDESETVSAASYTGLDDDAFLLLASEDGAEVIAHTTRPAEGAPPPAPPGPDGVPAPVPMLHDVTIRRRTKQGRVAIVPMPPEELIIDRNARSIEDATLVAHRREVTVSDLVAMGYDADEIEALASGSGDQGTPAFGEEAQARRPDGIEAGDTSVDPALRKLVYTEAYLRVDRDGDGIAELRLVCTVGTSNKVLKDEPIDHRPFADWCPVPLQHAFFGLSIADLTMDLQRIKSVIVRQVLDNLVLANHPRVAVVENQVEMDDVLNDEMGAVIRMKQPGMYQPMAVPFVAGQSLPVLDMLDGVRESRTGLSRASVGMDPDALQSTTRAAAVATLTAAQSKVELVARIFAETGLKKLFRGILRLVCRHQDRARMIRLRNRWVPVDPRAWSAEMDVTVNVGLGRGTDEERLAALAQVKATQEAILQQYGLNNPLVTLAQYRNTLAKMLEIAGFKDAGQFFQDPGAQPPQQPAPPPPDPKLIEAQGRLQLETQKAQADLDLQRMRMEAENALKREAMQLEHQRKLDQMQAEMRLREAQMTAELALARESALLGGSRPPTAGAPVQMGGDVG